jgi:putative inorganic carbon (HCO3(-)) transporter
MPARVVGDAAWPRRSAWAAALAAAAAAAGVAYAWSAYTLNPAVLPVVLVAGLALALGLWRLECGLALLLFVTPFAENAQISDPGHAKLRLALVLWAIVLTVVRFAGLARSEERIEMPPVGRAALAFVVVALIAVPVAEKHGAAAAKFLLLVGSVTIFVLIATSLHDWRRLEIVLAGAVLTGLVVSVHAIYQQLSGHLSRIGFIDTSGTVEYRVTSVFSHPNQLAGFLAVLIPVAAVLARHFSRRWLRAAAGALVVLGLIAVVITYSRGALMGLLALPLLALRNPRSWPLLAAGLVAIALLAPGGWRERVENAGNLRAPEIATRVDIWTAATDAFEQRPLLGWGLNNFPTAYVSLERPGRSFLGNGQFDVPPTAHNLYLNVAAEQGLLGVAALLALGIALVRMTALLRRDADPRRRAMGVALLGVVLVLALHNLFDVTFVDPKTSALAWALFGVGAALVRPEPAGP